SLIITMSVLGMVMINDSWFSPVIIPSLVAAVVALLAGAALAGDGGGGVGHASEEARDRELGADVMAASIAAFGAVVLTLVAMQVRQHAIVFGALSGESIGGVQRVRILNEGARESRAMLAGGVVAALPALVALALVCVPRLRIVLRGVSAGMRT